MDAETPLTFVDADDDVEKSRLLGHAHTLSLRPVARSRMANFTSLLRVVFYASATVCLWVVTNSVHQATKSDTPVQPKEEETASKPLYMGYGNGDWGLAEEISGQVPVGKSPHGNIDALETQSTQIVLTVDHTLVDKQLWMFWNDSKFILDDPKRASPEHELTLKKAWESIVPEGNGFILIDDPHNPALPPPINRGPETDVPMDRFCLTVFHQLHCLRGIQEAFYALVKEPTSKPMLAHVNHCIDYLRVGVMCYGDTALEGQSTYSSKERANGNGSNHVCKDFGALLDWANGRSSHRKARESWDARKGRHGVV